MSEHNQPIEPRFTYNRFLMGIGILLVLVICGWLYATFGPAEMAYRRILNAGFDSYAFEDFIRDYPKSYRMADMDDLLYRQVTLQFEDTERWQLYRRLLPNGRHAAELDKLLSDRKQTELAALRSNMDLKRAVLFLQWFSDTPEAAECRKLLLNHLEKAGAGNRSSPPIAIFRRLLQSATGGQITYTMTGYTYESAIPQRLFRAFQDFGIQATEGNAGQIRIQTERIEDNDHPLTAGEDLKVPSLTVRSELSIFLPGESNPAWTHTFDVQSPAHVKFMQPSDSHDDGNFTVAVADATNLEMDGATQGLFRYWLPEPEQQFWSRFQEYRRWLGNGNPSAAEKLERLNALPIDGVLDPTLFQIHSTMKEMFENQVAEEQRKPEEGEGVRLDPIVKAVEYELTLKRYLAVADSNYGK